MTHNEILDTFLAKHPRYEKHQLRKKLNAVLKHQDDEAFVFPLGYTPDAFCIDADNKLVSLLEVDGSSYTDDRKMPNILSLWWELDARGWRLELRIFSVYTLTSSVVKDSKFQDLYWNQYWKQTEGRAN